MSPLPSGPTQVRQPQVTGRAGGCSPLPRWFVLPLLGRWAGHRHQASGPVLWAPTGCFITNSPALSPVAPLGSPCPHLALEKGGMGRVPVPPATPCRHPFPQDWFVRVLVSGWYGGPGGHVLLCLCADALLGGQRRREKGPRSHPGTPHILLGSQLSPPAPCCLPPPLPPDHGGSRLIRYPLFSFLLWPARPAPSSSRMGGTGFTLPTIADCGP